MADNKKKGTLPPPKLGDIAAELIRARTRAGLSHSELHRLTGISRPVLFGYEAGRTRPGAKEIRLLCDALKVTPNRLIYGSDDSPFKNVTGPLPLWMDFDSQDYGTINSTVLIMMLSREERLALTTLAYSILESRHGKQYLEEAFRAVGMMGKEMTESGFLSLKKLEAMGEKIEKKIAKPTARSKKRN
jgi:transcriptional regulator with XRE-family HTH domain